MNYQQRIIELAEQNNNLTKTYNSLSNDLLSINEYGKIKNQLEESNNETVSEFGKIIKQLEELNNKTINESKRIKQLLQDYKNKQLLQHNENKQKISAELIKLFPADVINIILPYIGDDMIIQLQDYFPNQLTLFVARFARQAELA